MAETQRGGVYLVDGKYVDAYGKEVKKAKDASTDVSNEAKRATEQQAVYVEGVDFASDAAGEAAKAAGLTAADFEGVTASGASGFTKPDVAKIVEAKG